MRGKRALVTLLRPLQRSRSTSQGLRSLASAVAAPRSASDPFPLLPRSPQLVSGARLMALTAERSAPVEAPEAPKLTTIHPKVVFVLGGPGSGKGTQCSKIVEKFGFVHLSAGDLLRAEINSGSENGTMIQNMIQEGKIVPSEVTVKLLQKAMLESGNDKFLIDGFPRNEENRASFERVTGIDPEFILFFDCPQEEMEVRLLGRNEGRVDDNIETIRKRFKVFVESSLPVVEFYDKKGKVRKVNAVKSKDEVFQSIEPLFEKYINKLQDPTPLQHAA